MIKSSLFYKLKKKREREQERERDSLSNKQAERGRHREGEVYENERGRKMGSFLFRFFLPA